MLLERRGTGIDHEISLVINDALEMARGHIKDQPEAGGHALEEPDVRTRHCQLDVAHAFAADARQRHFHTATVTNDAPMLDALILSAGAFPILDRTENAFAE